MKRTCPDCGLEYVPKGAGRGCPHCLLRLAMPETETDGGAADPPAPAGLKSRFFAGYEIMGEIARGGMGVIYRARQMSLNREVALKMIQAGHLLSMEARLRFKVEVEAVAQLNHPNIVSLYESGEQDGIHYFTMRLVEGGNLGDYLHNHTSVRDQVALLIKVCRTVHYAHQRGILHRDLKPSNILVDLQGEPHVADFGLAKSLDYESGFTYSNTILGSPNYMAPEQATSHSGPVSVASDVYGLGAILYHLLAGRPPFEGKTPIETIRHVVDTEPASLRRLNPQIDADIATICMKCLEKKPSDRYETAEELARDLEHWLRGLPISARPVGTLGNLWRWSRRHPAVSALSAALGLALIGFVTGVPVALLSIQEAQREAVSHLRESLLDQARLLRLSAQRGARSEGLRLIREAVDLGGPGEFRDRARDEMLATLAITDMEFAPQAEAPDPDPVLSLLDPQLERLALIEQKTNLVLRRLADNSVLLHSMTGTSAVSRVEAFSPDGRFLALRHVDGIGIWDTHSGTKAFSTNGPARVFAFAPQGPWLILEEWDYGLSVVALPSGQVLHRFQADPDPPGGRNRGWVAFGISPDGTMLAAARRQNNVLDLVELASGRTRWSQPMDSLATAFAWQTIHRRLIVAGEDGVARLLRWDDGASSSVLGLGGPVRSIALDDSNTVLAAAGEDRVVRLWNLASYQPIFQTACDAHRVEFDSSGTRLGSVRRGHHVGWLDLSRSFEFQEILVAGAGNEIERCAFNHDGRIVAGGLARQIDLRRVSDGRFLCELQVERLPIFAFDPTGEGLVTSDSRGVAYRPMIERAPGQIDLEPPRWIVEGMRWRAVAFSGDGHRFFAANAASNLVYAFDRPFLECAKTFGSHPGVDRLSVSHDGRLAATGSSSGRDARVWEIASGEELFSATLTRQSNVDLSPDGRWLLIHGDGVEMWDVGAKTRAPAIVFPRGQPLTGAACFAPNSRVLAMVIDQYEIQLFDLVHWKFLGRLRAPRDHRMLSLAFNHDGASLAASVAQGRLKVWSLARMRQRLAEAGLDWADAPLPDRERPPRDDGSDPLVIRLH